MSALDHGDLNGYDVTTMREIGVRELKATLAEVLRSVQSGEPVRVTRHGKVIAEIVPPRKQTFEERLDELAAQGLVTRAKRKGPLPPFSPRVVLPGPLTGSELIIAERESYYEDEA
jgi:prevent-host-death family protein